MTNSRFVLAVWLASTALVLFLVVIALGGALQAGLAPWPGIGLVVLATAAFVASRNQRSFLVAGLLVASGMVGLVYGLIVTGFFSVIVFPGPIIGVIIGVGIIGLGAAKGIEAARIGSKTATVS
ncbi:hypothetical protein Ngar_c15160 [Candidatus Nitrososphaera gargensis Ga9.2]|uniref:Uncharacterized protein n=1 Tax=Nitrososphaera gargensis (strain Ga9.2) TaxID=1237085 RepID=K0IAU0_NITGG|nr:hypothetical protein [Candidatus Nitrososphaera gargensis]AFU58451.1 hypothetical protein Ngar_c15160 [Candidatus Nitrososphaera gargensis Ga9.2]